MENARLAAHGRKLADVERNRLLQQAAAAAGILIAKLESPLDRLILPKASGRKRSMRKGAAPA
jgi:hypothetical protein